MYYPGYPSRFCLVAAGSLRKLGNLQIRASQSVRSARVLTGIKLVLTCVKKVLADLLPKFRFWPIQQLYRQFIGLISLAVGIRCAARPWGRYPNFEPGKLFFLLNPLPGLPMPRFESRTYIIIVYFGVDDRMDGGRAAPRFVC
jgi:hypothetical protein